MKPPIEPLVFLAAVAAASPVVATITRRLTKRTSPQSHDVFAHDESAVVESEPGNAPRTSERAFDSARVTYIPPASRDRAAVDHRDFERLFTAYQELMNAFVAVSVRVTLLERRYGETWGINIKEPSELDVLRSLGLAPLRSKVAAD